MKVCSHCRLEVPTTASICPGCLENPNDGYGETFWWILAIIAILVWAFW